MLKIRMAISVSVAISCSFLALFPIDGIAALSGYHDDANGSGASGWACDSDNFSAAVTVSVYRSSSFSLSNPGAQGAQYMGSTSANAYRSDLLGVCGGNGNHAFSLAWPSWANDGGGYYIYAVAQPVSGGQDTKLVNSPLYITFPPPPNRTPNGAMDDLYAVGQAVTARGWACDLDIPSQSLAIQIFAATWNMPDPLAQGATLVANATASGTRADVSSVCGGTVAHGFEVTLPASLNTGVPRYIYAYAVDANAAGVLQRLSNTPLGITFPAPPPPQNAAPTGWLDDLYAVGDSVYAKGWTCDTDTPSQSLTVEVWAATWQMPDPIAGNAERVVVGTAGTNRSDVAPYCAGTTAHGYSFVLPASLNTGVPRYVWAYALDSLNNTRVRLMGGPLGITFPVTVVQPVQNLSASKGTYADRVGITWTQTVTAGAGYNIYRCPTNNDTTCSSPMGLIVSLGSGTASYTDTSVAQTTHYMYEVRAFAGGAESLPSSSVGWAVPLSYDAMVRNSNVPSAMTVGDQYLSLTVVNTGSQPWSGSGSCRIGVRVDNIYNWPVRNVQSNTVYLPNGVTVLPGGQYTFAYVVRVPDTSINGGWRSFSHRMYRECAGFFGQAAPTVQVTIWQASSKYAANFGQQSVTTNMLAGQKYTVQIAMINLGRILDPYQTFPWTATNGYSLAPVVDIWGVSSVNISAGATVGWNGIASFLFEVTAPSAPGVYPFQWQMAKSGLGRFGDVTPLINVNVVEGETSSVVYATGTKPTFIPPYTPPPIPSRP